MCILSSCSQTPVKPSVSAMVDTQGPMPFMTDPKLMLSPGDPKIERARGELQDLESELHSLDMDGKWQEALEVAQAFVAKQRQILRDGSPFVAVGEGQVARFAGHLQDRLLQENALREELAIKRRYLGDGCVETAATVDTLATVLIVQGKVEPAASLVEECWASGQKQPPSLACRIYYLSTLAMVARAQGKRDKAAIYANEAVKLKRTNPEFYFLDPKIYNLLALAARCDLDLGLYDLAQERLTEYAQLRFDKRFSQDEEVVQMLVACAHGAELKGNRKQAQAAIKTAGEVIAGANVSPAVQLAVAQYRRSLGMN
jgi:tetratricopeptide (TPR) repeat protein